MDEEIKREIKTNIQDLKNHSTNLSDSFLNRLFVYLKTNFLFTKLTNPKEITDPIVKKLDDLKPHAPEKTTTPIVAGLKAVQSAIEGRTETDIRPQLELLGKILKDEIGKLDREVVVKNDLSQLLGLFKSNGDKKDVVNALKSIEKLIPKIQEVPDYTLLLSGVIDAIENIKLEIPQAQEAEKIGHYLQQIIDKAYPEFPELQFNKDGRLKVEVDRVGGGYGGLSSEDSNKLKTLATEAKQDSIIEKLEIVAGMEIPAHDTKVIDETDPDNTVITYKLNDVTVATKTIATSGSVTTFSIV